MYRPLPLPLALPLTLGGVLPVYFFEGKRRGREAPSMVG